MNRCFRLRSATGIDWLRAMDAVEAQILPPPKNPRQTRFLCCRPLPSRFRHARKSLRHHPNDLRPELKRDEREEKVFHINTSRAYQSMPVLISQEVRPPRHPSNVCCCVD